MITPSEQLKKYLNNILIFKNMRIIGDLDWPLGSQRRMDTCRWSGFVGLLNGDQSLIVRSIASWSTITDCVRHGFSVNFHPHRGEASIMVEANSPIAP